MKLPDHEAAQIPKGKITGYLLSTVHRDGRHKAAFFMRYGFSAEDWEALANALRGHAAVNDVARIDQTRFGQRYVVEGRLPTPDGGAPHVRVVWFVEHSGTTPRLVTAYPSERGESSG